MVLELGETIHNGEYTIKQKLGDGDNGKRSCSQNKQNAGHKELNLL